MSEGDEGLGEANKGHFESDMAHKERLDRSKRRSPKDNLEGSDALGFENELWASANKLRGNMDASEYKHVVLPLVFLKYISDAFEDIHASLVSRSRNPENRDEYIAKGVFWVA